MYRAFTILVLTIIMAASAGATESLSTDGAWWNDLTMSQKADVMFGSTSAYASGYFDGHSAAQTSASLAISDAKTLSLSQMEALTTKMDGQYSTPSPDFHGKPIRVYIEGMDNFYSSHPESIKANFGEVFKCIENRPTKTCNEVSANYLVIQHIVDSQRR